jgi:hypothetical protein
MQDYICQPYYRKNVLRFYKTINPTASSPYHEVDLTSDVESAWGVGSHGLNDVAIYNGKIFTSFDIENQGKGGVLIFNYSDIYPSKTATSPIVVKPGNIKGLPSAGIAINPQTGDLYIPTFNIGQDSGIYKYTAASGYVTSSQFASFNGDNSVAQICANLAFDKQGNLWMTTWSENNIPDNHFLICYKGLNKDDYFKITNESAPVYNATSRAGTIINALNLLSAPEGIGFDSDGNLWIGNNNDFAKTNNAGTLVKINASWINTMLSGTPTGRGGPIQKVPPTSVEIKYIELGKLGGVVLDENIIYVNDQGQNQGDDYNASGAVWKWDTKTPFNVSNFKESGIKTTYPGNGGAAFVQPLLIITDNALDTGAEPNITTNVAWESTDIWVRQTNDGVQTYQDVDGDSACFVYVRIKNEGIIPTSGNEKLKLYWAKASTGLGWPNPWTGTDTTLPIAGELIGVKDLGTIPPRNNINNSTIIEFPWKAPNPANYTPKFGTDDKHFCLLARLETQPREPFGMTYPEKIGSSNLVGNVLKNSKIAWKNIHIGDKKVNAIPGMIKQIVLMANYDDTKMNSDLTFEILNKDGNLVELGAGKIFISATGEVSAKILGTDFNREYVRVTEDGKLDILNTKIGIENIQLEPGEKLPLIVEYIPAEKTIGSVLRANQFAKIGSSKILIGGQTFVVGKVKGFPTDVDSSDSKRSKKIPFWLLILILLLLIIIFIYILK